ncbi:MAG: hypothetical protein Q4B65_00375 [Candidatus Saccharibacteria bacterium]|nr:hypothetical protein [Candidatus Saccharibacteria bacterium]
MERLSNSIQKIYQKYLPALEKSGVRFNLDFPDTTLTIPTDPKFEQTLEKIVRSAIKRTTEGSIDIIVRKNKIVIKDTGTPLLPSACEKLKNDHISVKSRIGFGTETVFKF